MGQGFDTTYKPVKVTTRLYAERYKRYKKFGKLIEKER